MAVGRQQKGGLFSKSMLETLVVWMSVINRELECSIYAILKVTQ